MSAARASRAGAVSNGARIAQARYAQSLSGEYVEAADGASAIRPIHPHAHPDHGDVRRRESVERRRSVPFWRPVVGFGGVLVSRAVGTVLLQAQADGTRHIPRAFPMEAEKNVAAYERNQLMAASMGSYPPVH